ncbi:MAG: hypothetical protein AAF515_19030 [Pseudomonadota bacterium]
MKTRLPRHLALVALAASAALLTGCFNSGDENSHRHVHLGSVSIGQQLLDLDKARASKVIDDAEYKRLREVLITGVERFLGPTNDAAEIQQPEGHGQAWREDDDKDERDDEDGDGWLF